MWIGPAQAGPFLFVLIGAPHATKPLDQLFEFLVGEDLGTVEPGVREALASAGILGTKVAWFEPDPPTRWPEPCLATITTHDLPTIAGVWQARDGDRGMAERLESLTSQGGVQMCGNAQNCVAVCPKSIPLTRSIARAGRAATIWAIRKIFDR